jgi:hypothetical protein
VRALAAAHPDALYLEVGPGSVLAGLVQEDRPRRCDGSRAAPPRTSRPPLRAELTA